MNALEKTILTLTTGFVLTDNCLPKIQAAETGPRTSSNSISGHPITDERLTKHCQELTQALSDKLSTAEQLTTKDPHSVLAQIKALAEFGLGANLVDSQLKFYLVDPNNQIGLTKSCFANLQTGQILVNSYLYQRAIDDQKLIQTRVGDQELQTAWKIEFGERPPIDQASIKDIRKYYQNHFAARELLEGALYAILTNKLNQKFDLPCTANFKEIVFSTESLARQALVHSTINHPTLSAINRVLEPMNIAHLPLRLVVNDLLISEQQFKAELLAVSAKDLLIAPKWHKYPSIVTNQELYAARALDIWNESENTKDWIPDSASNISEMLDLVRLLKNIRSNPNYFNLLIRALENESFYALDPKQE